MFDELLRHPGVVEECELRSPFGFLAIHGGSLERGTAEVAAEAAERAGASLYAVRQPEDLHWHIPSALVDPSRSPALNAFLEYVELVVSVHGYGRKDHANVVLIGGRNRQLAARAAAVLRTACRRIDSSTTCTRFRARPGCPCRQSGEPDARWRHPARATADAAER